MGAIGWTQGEHGVRGMLRDARDETHFQLLRAAEGLRDRWPEDGAIRAREAVMRLVLVGAVVASVVVAWPVVAGADWFGAPMGTDNARPSASTPRADTIIGTHRNDRLVGGSGADVLSGGIGNDQLLGGSGNDTLQGGDGDDTLMAGNGQDVLFGGKGDDVLYVQTLDGVDRALCGPGHDIVHVARINKKIPDRVVGCEQVIVDDFIVKRPRSVS